MTQSPKDQGAGQLDLSRDAQEDAREEEGGAHGVQLDGRQIHLCPGVEVKGDKAVSCLLGQTSQVHYCQCAGWGGEGAGGPDGDDKLVQEAD